MDMCYEGALVMPSNYAVMDEEEMTYVEGGKVYKIQLSARQCGDIAAAGAGAAAAAQFLNFIPEAGMILAVSIAAVAGTYSAYFWLASNHNGMNLNIITAGNVCLGMVPTIRW
ncbi:MAG: hypothetical protein MRZ75_08195 [Roseburia sp.]|nr:hypothetical protein [Roseburia sp.]MDY5883597.1 hypothetical protein [Roseburia sp.]